MSSKRRMLAATAHRGQTGTIAEFGPTLFILFTVLLFLVSLSSVLAGFATVSIACQMAAREAASAGSFTTARDRFQQVGDAILNGPFGQFSDVQPAGNAALQLVVLESAAGGGNAQVFPAPNTPDLNRLYQMKVQTVNGVTVRVLFWPVRVPVSSESSCVVEHPEGLGT